MSDSLSDSEFSCPCSSGKQYAQCCGPYLSDAMPAPTPEALMRSRYTAFATQQVDYIFSTMASRALKQADRQETTDWSASCEWLGLEVLDSPSTSGTQGVVEFIAKFREGEVNKQLHERSLFKKEGQRWYYVGSEQVTQAKDKAGRNDPCPCGSGKKYKKCCLG